MLVVLRILSLILTWLTCENYGRRLQYTQSIAGIGSGSQHHAIDTAPRSQNLAQFAELTSGIRGRGPTLLARLAAVLLAFNFLLPPPAAMRDSRGLAAKNICEKRVALPCRVLMKQKHELGADSSHIPNSSWRRRWCSIRSWRGWGVWRRCRRWLAQLARAEGASPSLPASTYLQEYNQLYYHIGMLKDNERMGAYHQAILKNAGVHFRGKVVLDVGAGTGVLSLWAAQAGAAKVYAVEATPVATMAKRLVKAHGFEETVVVLQGRMEEIELPEQVDVILSEWMGYFLLREAMVQSVLYARDKWLKPTGVMYPSHARLMIAALDEPGFSEARAADVDREMDQWDYLVSTLSTKYSLDFDTLRDTYQEENLDYYYRHAWQSALGVNALVGTPQVVLSVDMHNTSMEELFGWHSAVQLEVPSRGNASRRGQPVHTLCGWFDATFCASETRGRGGSSNVTCVELSTSPFAPRTHWTQTSFVLDPPLPAPYKLDVGVEQDQKSQHDLDVNIRYQASSGAEVNAHYAITESTRSQLRVPYGLSDAAV